MSSIEGGFPSATSCFAAATMALRVRRRWASRVMNGARDSRRRPLGVAVCASLLGVDRNDDLVQRRVGGELLPLLSAHDATELLRGMRGPEVAEGLPASDVDI